MYNSINYYFILSVYIIAIGTHMAKSLTWRACENTKSRIMGNNLAILFTQKFNATLNHVADSGGFTLNKAIE